MPQRKVSHHRRILSETRFPVGGWIWPHNIIRFRYHTKNNWDLRPLVYVLPAISVADRKLQRLRTHIFGINLNYLNEYTVQKLLSEPSVAQKDIRLVRFKHWNMYEDAFRTYLVNELKEVKLVTYKTDAMLELERIERKKKRRGR